MILIYYSILMPMKKKLFFVLIACLIGGTATVSAQKKSTRKAVNVENGKEVKRITFNCEDISIVYADGTEDESVQAATIVPVETPTGINGVEKKAQTNGWYTMDGRRLQSAPKDKGVYVVKKGDKVQKTIKK